MINNVKSFIFSTTISSFKESKAAFFISQHKEILAVTSLIFASLAIYWIKNYVSSPVKLKKDDAGHLPLNVKKIKEKQGDKRVSEKKMIKNKFDSPEKPKEHSLSTSPVKESLASIVNFRDKNRLLSYLSLYGSSLKDLDLKKFGILNDQDLIQIVDYCPLLESLNLNGFASITDAGLEHLKALTALQSLHLHECKRITDAGLEHLKVLTTLQSLNLTWCRNITDAGLEHLKALTALQSLDLYGGTNITDASLKHLKGLTALRSLNLGGCTKITDAGLEHLKVLAALQSLQLIFCNQITDTGLEHLKVLSALQSLGLTACNKITDAGLEHLKILTSLQSLILVKCDKVTPSGYHDFLNLKVKVLR